MSDRAISTFSSRAARHGETLELLLEGDANMNAVDDMGRILDDIHSSSLREPTTLVVIDVRNLEFMNSSCFKKFVTWLGRVQELPPGSQYKIQFLSDPKMHWQRRSLHVLQCFASELVSIET